MIALDHPSIYYFLVSDIHNFNLLRYTEFKVKFFV